MSLRCTAAGQCDAHKDGAATTGEKCAYYCDHGKCRRKAVVNGSHCREHAPGPGHPRTTGSKMTRPIQFRVSTETRAALTARGKRDGISADQVAHRIVLAAL